MKTELIYIEKETGANHNGLARIGKCFYSKSGQSVYFNGSVFKKCKGFSYNYFDIESGEGYWISGVKQDGSDRHKFGFGIIEIDITVVEDYLKIIGENSLPKNKFKVVELDNIPAKQIASEIENEKYKRLDYAIINKSPKDLSDDQLKEIKLYYEDLELSDLFKKARKLYKGRIKEIEVEYESRINKTTHNIA